MAEEDRVAYGEASLAVDGQDIYFYFDRKKKSPVLAGVSIVVPRGIIYSLLGPSGCGKTTLLKCVVGQHKLQGGSLKVYGRAPGSKGFFIPGRGVGYMPQDLALYLEMTIEEILTYYGSLYGLNRREVKERIAFLIDLLELPEKRKLIKHLSGGQQRRVSFAIALIHKPPLLILDEPTVGVDPLLRQTIWDHLVSLTKNEHLTVIITTHYTEEARQADTVGLMRNGQLLVQRNPETLIKQCGVVTLEDVFRRICRRNQNKDENPEATSDVLTSVESIGLKCLPENDTTWPKNGVHQQNSNAEQVVNNFGETCLAENDGIDTVTALLTSPSHVKDVGYVSTSSALNEYCVRLWCLTKKNLLRLKRNIFLLMFMSCVPTIQIVTFCLCIGSDPFDLPVAVVNMDQDVNGYGRSFLHSINNRTIYQMPFDNITLAYESVENGKSWAAVHIGPEFSTCFLDRFMAFSEASNDTIRCSTIKIHLDTTNYIIANTIRLSLLASFEIFTSDLMENLGKNPLLTESPLEFEEVVHGTALPTFAEFLAPALIVCVAYITSIGLTEMAIITEKKQGLLDRTLVAGGTVIQVVLSFAFALLMLSALQLSIMLVFTVYVFKIPCNGPFFWVLAALLLVGVSGMAYGFLISTVTDDENAAAIIAFGSFFPVILISGMLWPVEAMPHYLRYVSYCLPLTLIIDSVRCISTRGWNITEYHVWDGYLVCTVWIFVPMALAIILLKYKK